MESLFRGVVEVAHPHGVGRGCMPFDVMVKTAWVSLECPGVEYAEVELDSSGVVWVPPGWGEGAVRTSGMGLNLRRRCGGETAENALLSGHASGDEGSGVMSGCNSANGTPKGHTFSWDEPSVVYGSIHEETTCWAHWEFHVNCPSVLPVLPAYVYSDCFDTRDTAVRSPVDPVGCNSSCHFVYSFAVRAGGAVVVPGDPSCEMSMCRGCEAAMTACLLVVGPIEHYHGK